MELIFAYLAGLLTLINPCVLPVLPIVLASGLQKQRHAPLALAAGMSVTFVVLGITVATMGRTIGLDEMRVIQIGAYMMLAFGLILLVPAFNRWFSLATAGFASKADAQIDAQDQGTLRGQFIAGALLGAVWSPCTGPTLGGAISLAYQGENLLRATGIMVFFAFGISTVVILLGYGAKSALQRRKQWMHSIAEKSKPLMGAVFILVAVLILSGALHSIEAWFVEVLPDWFQELSISI